MFLQSAYMTEFLAESNLVLTQEDYGNKLYDLLSPIRNLLHKEKQILSFSLARYCGGNSRLAFFCEWYYQTLKLTFEPMDLLEENRLYFRKKVPLRLRGVPNLYDLVDEDIERIFLPEQIAFMHVKSQKMIEDLLVQKDFLAKYLNSSYLSQITASQIAAKKRLYVEEMSVNQYLDAQAMRLSFVQICLPCLLSFTFTFNQPDNPINPKGIKWALVEEILRTIAILHQTNESAEFAAFVYASRLSEKEEFNWLQMGKEARYQLAKKSVEVKDIVNNMRAKLFEKSLRDWDNLVFPDKDKQMLKDLLEWSYVTES